MVDGNSCQGMIGQWHFQGGTCWKVNWSV